MKIKSRILPSGDLEISREFVDDNDRREVLGCVSHNFLDFETELYTLIQSDCGLRQINEWEFERLNTIVSFPTLTSLYYDNEDQIDDLDWVNNTWIYREFEDWVDVLIEKGRVIFESVSKSLVVSL
jgi:hypothetical protein